MTKDILLKQFATCYNENGWFVAVRNTLEGVTAEQAVWKPEGSDNSIWETLAHLSYYNNAYLIRFGGANYEYKVADNDATFEAPENPTDEDWKVEVENFDRVLRGLRSLIEAADDRKFDEHVSATNKASWAELILNINAHNAYHGGQILLIRKLQGSWNPENGLS
jgi:uncharacterized damage-inducible protein DinB